MVLQQFSGINAVMLYSSFIFTTAGMLNPGDLGVHFRRLIHRDFLCENLGVEAERNLH